MSTTVLTKRQQSLRPSEYEREVGRLRYAARLRVLDSQVAVARRLNRQADKLEAMLRASTVA